MDARRGNAGVGLRGALILSPQAQEWASSNGHAGELEGAKRLLAEWNEYRANNGYRLQLTNLPADVLAARAEKLRKRLAVYESVMGGGA